MNATTGSNTNNPIEIGILEIRRHIPILYTFSRICKTKNTNVTIFTTKELLSQLKTYLKDTENYDIVLKEDKESTFSFLKRVEKICNEGIDLLLINTIKENCANLIPYITFKPKCKKILTVHHANAWLKPKLVFNMKHPRRTIDTNISSFLIKGFILPKFDAINVIYCPLKNYILHHTTYDKEIFTLLTSIFDKAGTIITTKQKDDKILRVVMPGLIEERRKNYSYVVPAFQNLFRYFRENLQLCFLGMPVDRYGIEIYKSFKTLEENGYNIILFDKYVQEKIFKDFLTKSDVILAPIRIKTRGNVDNEETYGVTVGSGIVFDAIRYAKPIIVPT